MQEALAAFGARGYDAVGVTELAASAGVTIGSLYHHFGSKAGLYDLVRTDVERRVLDRMEGAAAVRDAHEPAGLAVVLLVGYDYLVGSGFARLLAEPRPDEVSGADAIAAPSDQAKIVAKPWGVDPALGIRVEAHVLAVLQFVDVELQILSTGIHDPELGNTR